jgi:hypothetical protein
MGRLIISETERKNILSLYESDNVAPPPSESVLVAIKNPFKYPEYESARRKYSSDLKNGDMFYYFDNFAYEKDLNNNVSLKLIKKSIRINWDETQSDTIYYITDLRVSSEEINVYLNDDLNYLSYDFSLSVTKDTVKFNYMSKNEKTREQMELLILPKLAKLIENIKLILNDYSTKIKLPKENISLIPDKFFGVYKIQRINTDF